MPTTTELTERYISERKSIKECLKKGLLNYSALSRQIGKDLGIEKKTSKEAILIAARRYREKIADKSFDEKIITTFQKSNIEIKNNIVAYTLEKTVYPDSLIDIEKRIKKEKSLFFSIEGTKTITVIIQKHDESELDAKYRTALLSKKKDLSLITINTPDIGSTPGIVSYISGLFSEKGINIEEFMSCYEDTLIVVKTSEIKKIFDVLNF